MKRRSKWKIVVILLTVVAVLAAAGGGGWYYLQNRTTEPVNVYPFSYIGMTEYWGDSQESYGPVTSDGIQTVFLSDTQTVTELLVSQGDVVKKGDVLMRYDTSLSNISIERERLEMEKVKLQLSKAEDALREICNMRPMEIPEETPEETTEPDLGVALTGNYQVSQDKAYDGSGMDKALILWLRTDAALDDTIFEVLRQYAEDYQKANQSETTAPATEPAEPTDPEPSVNPGTDPTVPSLNADDAQVFTQGTANTTEETTETTEKTTEATEETTVNTEETTEATEETTEDTEETTAATEETTEATEETTEATEEATVPPSEPSGVDRFYVVIKTTVDNMSRGHKLFWQGLEVTKTDNGFQFKLFNAGGMEDHMLPKEEIVKPVVPDIDMGSGYTAEQIAKLKSEKEKEIRKLQFQVKMAEVNYALQKAEIDNGEVKATVDGTVVSLISEKEAKVSAQPYIKISDGGGFYVGGFISELSKEELQIGQEVTVKDWNNGVELIGTVQNVGDFPTGEGSWNGMGNPNVSYYPFTVFVDGSADLQEGTYVSVVYSTASNQQGIYLENPFLRTEQGQTYVYVRGADDKLEKRAVVTGKSLWGSYTEILEGLSSDDLIAFPYGKTVVEGADTVESDLSTLYG